MKKRLQAAIHRVLPYVHLLGIQSTAKPRAPDASKCPPLAIKAALKRSTPAHHAPTTVKAMAKPAEPMRPADFEEAPSADVLRDRLRCARIVAHGINANTPRTAAYLAFNTSMSAKSACEVLDRLAD